jgi:hypothetical protein
MPPLWQDIIGSAELFFRKEELFHGIITKLALNKL